MSREAAAAGISRTVIDRIGGRFVWTAKAAT
jgi:hypothetical protein